MCTIIIVAALVSVTCSAPRLTPADAVAVIAPYAYVAPVDWSPRDGPQVVIAPYAAPMPTPAPTRVQPSVYGIPYPWTPLTWAILHSGRTQ